MIKLNNKIYYKRFYNTIDGFYSSYWSGKFSSLFINDGKKLSIEKLLEQAYRSIKINIIKLPLLVLLEGFIRVRPLFNLGVIIRRGKERQYPILLKKPKQISLAVRWVSHLVMDRKEWYLGQRVINEVISTLTDKRHILVQRRDRNFKIIIKNRSNIRYS